MNRTMGFLKLRSVATGASSRSRNILNVLSAAAVAMLSPMVIRAQTSGVTVDSVRDVARLTEISRLNVADHITEISPSTLSQLLAGRFPGLQVMREGATGIRGLRLHRASTISASMISNRLTC